MSDSVYYFDTIKNAVADVTDKTMNVQAQIITMLNRTQQMFKWSGLPDTIPQRFLEMYLQTNGNCLIAKFEDKLYAYVGGFGGVPDEYYQPTIYTVANPYQKFSKNFKLDEEAILIRNDSLMQGLLPISRKYATMICENEISLQHLMVNKKQLLMHI